MQKIFQLLDRENFKRADFGCSNFEGTFIKGNTIFAVRKFFDRTDLQKWFTYQEEINKNIYIKVDPSKKLDIYFVLYLSFKTNLQDIPILHTIEKDPYYCRKIIIRDEHFDEDKFKFPFLSFDIQESPESRRAKTIKEFLDLITKNEDERNIAEKIFEMKDEINIAKLLIDFFSAKEGKY